MWGAVAIGLGSMIGAGLFSVFGPAAAAAGDLLPVALAVAAVVAWCNARSSAQLAAAFPTAGGSYVYGRRMLGPWPGFVAGWGFVVGKTASCAAIALTIGHAVLPDPWARVVAVGAVVLVLGVNAFGITRTALASWVIVGFVLAVLVALLVATLAVSLRGGAPPSGMSGPAGPDGFGVLRAAGLLFFAFAGYARVATLGEEVRDPKRTIPRAITVALLVTLVVYGLVCAAVLTVLGTDGVAASLSPVVATARAAGPAWLPVLVTVAAVVAAAGSLLALTAGVGRTTLAMAREGDLPAGLSRLDRRHSTPWVADVVLGVIVCALVSTGDITTVIGFSSFAVLVYYLVANLSAFRQQGAHRLSSRVVQVVGAAGCVALACSLPIVSVLAGLAVLLLGVGYRIVRRRLIGTPT